MSSTAEGEPLAAMPDPVAPVDAPDLAVVPLGIGGVLAAWEPISDAETYEVYVSINPIVAFDPGEFLGEGPATSLAIGQLPDGSDLPYQPIYVRVRPKSPAGTGPASDNVSATPRKATTGDVASEYVYAGTVSATQVTSGNLAAVVALIGSLTVGASSGRRIVLSPSGGFQVLDEDGGVLVNFPTDTGTPNVFNGDGVFQGLTALGRAEFRGNDNEISRNSSFTLAVGVTRPSNAPILEVIHGQTLAVNPGTFYRGEYYATQGDWLFTVGNDGGEGGFDTAPDRWFAKWEWIDGVAGAVTRFDLPGYLNTLYTANNARYARVGTENYYIWWELGSLAAVPANSNQGWYYQRFNDAGALVGAKTRLYHPMNTQFTNGSGFYTVGDHEQPVVGEESGKLSVIYRMLSGANDNKLVKTLVNPADGTVFSTTVSPQSYLSDTILPTSNWGIGNYDRGGSRLLLSFVDNTTFTSTVRFFNPATMEEYAAEITDFKTSGYAPLMWDAADSRYYSIRLGLFDPPDMLIILLKFSKNTTEDYVWAAYTWYDSDPGGTGVHETTLSPYAYILRKKYASLHFKEPVAPADAGDADSPDSARFYLVTGTVEPVSEQEFREITPITTTTPEFSQPKQITLDFLVSAVAPPVLNTFPEGNAAELKSGIGGFVVKGDGTGEWPHFETEVVDPKVAPIAVGGRLAAAAALGSPNNYNSIIDSGWYMMASTATNAPVASLCYLEVRSLGSGYTEQVATHFTSGAKYTRIQSAGVWGPWITTDTGWIVVGTAGAPPFLSGWTNYGSGFTPVRFRRRDGVTHIEGLAAGGSIAVAACFLLPAGFRTSGGNLIFNTRAHDATSRTDIRTDGYVVMHSGAGNAWWSFAGVSFLADA